MGYSLGGIVFLTLASAMSACKCGNEDKNNQKFPERPNILFCIADDMSWEHAV